MAVELRKWEKYMRLGGMTQVNRFSGWLTSVFYVSVSQSTRERDSVVVSTSFRTG